MKAINPITSSSDPISISRERMAEACRDDARRVAIIAAPLLTMCFLLEALGHVRAISGVLFLQPIFATLVCAFLWIFGRRMLPRIAYPELVLLLLLGLVLWSIGLHMQSAKSPRSAINAVMLAVTTMGSATLVMPLAAAVLSASVTIGFYTYAQTVYLGVSEPSMLVVPGFILMVVTMIHWSRRSAIRSVEELRERVAKDQQELEEINEQLLSLSITDSLTGALNRRGFDDRLKAEIANAARRSEPASVLLFDVDNFKNYNDEFGHPAGDVALVRTAETLKACSRAGDSVARYGGEEFALILPATDSAACQRVAQRARLAVAALDQLARPITVSGGGVTAQPGALTDLDAAGSALVSSADDLLYQAKKAGRDRSRFAELPA